MHPSVLAHPRLSNWREVAFKRGDMSSNRLRKLAFGHRPLGRECLHDIAPGERDRLDRGVLGQLGNREVQMSYADAPVDSVRGVLQDKHAGSISLNNLSDGRQASLVLALSPHVLHSPIDRRQRTFEEHERKTARARINRKHQNMRMQIHTGLLVAWSARSRTLSRKSNFMRVVAEPSPCSSSYS